MMPESVSKFEHPKGLKKGRASLLNTKFDIALLNISYNL